jgi:hypothetical protein
MIPMYGTPEAFAVKVITTVGAREQYTMDDMKLPLNNNSTIIKQKEIGISGSRQKKNYLEEVYNKYFLNKRFIRSEIEAKNPALGERSNIEAIWLVVANRE